MGSFMSGIPKLRHRVSKSYDMDKGPFTVSWPAWPQTCMVLPRSKRGQLFWWGQVGSRPMLPAGGPFASACSQTCIMISAAQQAPRSLVQLLHV
jgi:hypothetical protein